MAALKVFFTIKYFLQWNIHDDEYLSLLQSKACSGFEFYYNGEYFQFRRILVKHYLYIITYYNIIVVFVEDDKYEVVHQDCKESFTEYDEIM